MLGWINQKLESRLLGEISITSDMQMIPLLMAESEEELKSLLMSMKDESEKSRLKTQYSRNQDHDIQSHHFMANRWGKKNGNSDRLYFLELQNHCGRDCSHEIKRHLLLGTKVVTNLDNILKSKTSLCWQRYV